MASSNKPKSGFRSVRMKNKDNISPKSVSRSRKWSKDSSKSRDTTDSHSRNKSQSVMVRLKRLDTLRLNQRIKVRDYGYGTIRFLGCVHFAQGLFVGVELDEAMGKHDGMCRDTRYFTAKEKHGVLVKQHRVELLDIDPSSPELAVDSVRKNNKGSMHFNLDEEFSLMEQEESEEEETEDEEEGGRGTQTENELINELMLRNRKMTEDLNVLRADVEDKEAKIEQLMAENGALRAEKTEFEDEMEAKIEELEAKMQRITDQLATKDEVLQKQIGLHERTKAKFKRKVFEFDQLKTKNQDTVQLVLYGDSVKDDIIAESKRSEKRHRDEKQECFLEIDRIKAQCSERLNKHIEDWILDCGDLVE